MNKLLTKITTLFAGTALAVGVGIALSQHEVKEAKADSTTFNFNTIASEEGWNSGSQHLSVKVGVITLTASGGSNAGKYYSSDHSWRIYNGDTCTITADDGYDVTAVSASPTASFSISNGIATWNGGRRDFTSIEVTYQAATPTALTEIKSLSGTLTATVDDSHWDLSGLTPIGRTNKSTADEDISAYVDLSTDDVPGSVAGEKTVHVKVTPKDSSLIALETTIEKTGTVNNAPTGAYYTLDIVKNGQISSYTTHNDYSSNGKLWSVQGNMSMDGNFIRVGGQAQEQDTRELYSKESLFNYINKITVNHRGINGGSGHNFQFVSLTLEVSSDSAFSSITDTKVYSTAISGSGSFDYTPSGNNWNPDSYYRFTLAFINDGSKAGGLDISSIQFFKGNAPVAPTGVSVSPTEADVQLGKTLQLVPTVLPDNATDKSVTYEVTSATPAGCISVDSDGTVHGNAIGSGVVTVTDIASHTATSEITVVEAPAIIPSVNHIDGNTGDAAVHVTFDALYGALVESEDISITEGNTVISLSNITTTGFDVNFLDGGNATIKITDHTDSTVFATITVTVVKSQVNSVTLSKHFLALMINAEETLIADVDKQGSASGEVSWSSSSPSVASVDTNGKVKGLSEGSALITATAGDKSDTCTVEVGNKYVYMFGEVTSAGADEGPVTDIDTKYSFAEGGSFSDELNLTSNKNSSGYALRLAANNKAGSFSYALSNAAQYIEKVVIRAKSYGSDTGVKLNVTPNGGSEISKDVTSSYTDLIYTFSGSEDVNGFSVTSLISKRLYIAKIDVYFAAITPLASLDVDLTTAVKTTYYQGQSLVTTGIVVDGYDADNNLIKSNIPHSALSFTPSVLNTVGEHIEITVSYTNKDTTVATDTFEVEVLENTIESIAISGNYKTKYLKGDTALDKTGMVVTATYASGDTDSVNLDDLTFEGFDASTIGVKTINVSLTSDSSIHTQFEISVREAVRLDFFQEATKKNYYVGDTLDTTGLVVEIVYSNGTTEDTEPLLSGYMVSLREGESMETTGNKHVDITYPGLPVLTYEITVSEKPVEPVLKSLEVTQMPNKTTYYQGEDSSNWQVGLEITAHYYDGDDKIVTSECNIGSFSTQTDGIRTISATYSEKGITKSCTFDLTVLKVGLESISIKTPASKVQFKLGDNFDATGLVVTASFSNGTTQDIAASQLQFSGYNMNVEGQQTVVVSYTVDGITKTASYQITVSKNGDVPVDPTPGTKGNRINTGAIIGIAVGGAVLLAGLGVGIYFMVRKKKVK